MKKTALFFWLTLFLISPVASVFSATVFTADTYISPVNTNYDGEDIVISNCTVTMDGPHSFNSLLVATNGSLTHSPGTNGQALAVLNVTNAPCVLSGTNPTFLANSNIFTTPLVMDSGQTITYTNGVDYQQIDYLNGAIQIERTTNSSIPDGATVSISYSWNDFFSAGLNLNITNALGVTASGSIYANSLGYSMGYGPGNGFSGNTGFFDGSGGGDGGVGGMSAGGALGGFCYDSLYLPASLGSGGGASYAGSGGNGGGLIQIIAGGNVNIDGIVTANGANAVISRAGGGSGGGISISAATVSGSGNITANGGAGAPVYGGGGGGGRIAIIAGANNFSGAMTAYGGGGANYGGAGTIFTQLIGQTGLLLVNNGGNSGTNSSVSLPASADVIISGNAILAPSSQFSPRNLTVGANSTLSKQITAGNLAFSVSNLTVQAGGAISEDYFGFASGGSGGGASYSTGNFNYGGGGGHAGYGGAASVTNASGGSTYDSQTSPAQLGSAGGGDSMTSFGGSGGGGIQLTVSGILEVDGRISANGGNGSGYAGGGGSGGSVYLSVGSLFGSGTIAANGGNGVSSLGGGGGGGRVAVFYNTNNFSGTITAYGGGGAGLGGAGTIFLQRANAPQQIILDNNGNTAALATPLLSANGANLIVRNGASGLPGGSSTVLFGSLLVTSNASLAMSPVASAAFLITSNATFQSGSTYNVNASGYPGDSGNGSGGYILSSPYAGGGGGNGGFGGNSVSNLALGGHAGYQSISSPNTPGSGGGGYPSTSFGGYGGGYVQMTVNGTLQMNGVISANGGNGYGAGGGGGAGGAINLSAGVLSGTGAITANGGNGVGTIGGGGGGGCIAIAFNTNIFAGTVSAYGGGGASFGGAGTIYFKTNSTGRALLVMDNGGRAGAGSLIQSSSIVDLTVRSNSIVYIPSGTTTFANLLVSSNASIVATNYQAIIAANNITLQVGGSINANALGYIANFGPGAGKVNTGLPSFPGSGAGNGGFGGNSASNAVAGGSAVSNQANNPFTAGSGGGGNAFNSTGGNGGGAIELSVSGTVQLNGTLSANGGNGSGSGGGGGAGGSLYLSVGNLTGTGSISANGGNGANAIGGGGAGGMIAINLTQPPASLTNSFSGTISAYGGGGANYGGAGTIFIKTNFNNLATFIVDNGGNRGANTPLSFSSSSDSLILRNGALAYPTISGINFFGVLITSNATLAPFSNLMPMSIILYSNLIIQAGGGIIADSFGATQNGGNGRGNSSSLFPLYPCSGGGHGGNGAFGLSNNVPGGTTYDSMTLPNIVGSGGGGNSTSIGGMGGGIISLQFQNNSTLQVNGIISANGGNGSGTGGGGGSGGSIYISGWSITGTGAINANGGSGALNYGGGGGGGRIAIITVYATKGSGNFAFTGTVSAYGGGGANYGGAGTIYYQTNSQLPIGSLILDNNGNVGTNTAFTFASMNMTVQNGAIGQFPSSGLLDNILVLSNSALTTLVSSTPVTITASNVTIAAGGSFSVDGCGFTSQNGSGAGAANSGISGGAGHGGYGGGNSTNGGIAYDSIQVPIQAGSGGANYNSALGGNGGGALTLNVAGFVVVNGRLSANGTVGSFNTGSGAGGSLYLTNISSLSGNGTISANGGSATGSGGGGGGGRISLICTSNNFTGQLSASGGSGTYPGGAGTIFTKILGTQSLFINNGGIAGTNTPLSSSFSMPTVPFNLNISGAASVVPLTPLPLLSNLNLAASSTLTMPVAQSSLFIGVLSNATIAGSLNVDHLGYSQTNGPGAGSATQNEGSGGGYGGVGGPSASGTPGGIAYGNPAQPLDFGSGGGNGAATATGGSDGGGALHLSVFGTLNVNGNISANGNQGLQDDSGGGSGGSVWITAGTLSGNGNISAFGGNGVLYGGGGGSGGRIAIYTPTNNFIGTTNVSGGTGASPGQPGTIYLSSSFNNLQVISQSPTGQVLTTVSSVNLNFDDLLNPASVSASDFTLVTPSGTLAASNLSVTVTGPSSVQVIFPTQNLLGNYTIEASTAIASMFGQPLAQPYSGTFSIFLPAISGTVTDTNGTPVSGVLLQPNGGLTGITTDINGNYSLGVPTGWSGTVTPSLGTSMFVPDSMSDTNISGSLTNQNYLMVPTVAPSISTGTSGNNITFNWAGIPGVTYQLLWSTNLVTWQPLGGPLSGTNGPMQIVLPDSSNSAAFFRINASY